MRQRMSFKLRSTAWSASLSQRQDTQAWIESAIPRRVHHGCQVGHARAEFVGRGVAFPAERGGFGGGVAAACVRHDAETGLPRPAGRGEVAVAPAEHAEGGGVGRV
jgi:hypothetical protein